MARLRIETERSDHLSCFINTFLSLPNLLPPPLLIVSKRMFHDYLQLWKENWQLSKRMRLLRKNLREKGFERYFAELETGDSSSAVVLSPRVP